MRRALLLTLLAFGCSSGGSATGEVPPDVSGAADTAVDSDVPGPGDTAIAADADADLLDDATPSDDAAPPVDGEPGETVSPGAAWCDTWATAYCALLAKCPIPGAIPASDCHATARAECGGDAVADAVAAGTASIDAAAAFQCLDLIEETNCPEFFEALRFSTMGPLPECNHVVVGTIGQGLPCHSAVECASGVCDIGDTCPGTCTANEAVTPIAVGDPCYAGMCPPPLTCGVDDRCAAVAGLNDPCEPTPGCFFGLLCEAGTCKALPTLGGACVSSDDCDPRTAAGTLVCVGGVCDTAPAAGQPCVDYRCNGSFCDLDAIPPTCAALPENGAPCALGGTCAAGLTCNDGTCAPRSPDGGTCTSPGQCASGRCVAGHCTAPGAAPCPG